MIDRDRLVAWGEENNLEITGRQADQLDRYAQLLVEWNEKMNLTAITDPEGVLVKHLMDSLTVLRSLPAAGEKVRLIDVGTGAGFPGIPLAVMREELELTLLDSLNKRLVFLRELCAALELPVTLIHARAEEGGRQPALREQFDVATARAVAALPVLAEYCLPFVKQGGRFIAMKGPEGEAEAAAAAKAVARLGGAPAKVHTVLLPVPPDGEAAEERRLLVIDKIAATPPAYPRPSAKIARQPL